MPIPEIRVDPKNAAPVRPDRDFVLYWMIAARRTRYSFALELAVDEAIRLRRPLVVLEALRCDYLHASDRLHRFVLDGMADNAARFEQAGVAYLPYVEPGHGAGKGLLKALGDRACLIVTDEFPCFFLPRMVRRAAAVVDCRMVAVDGLGLLPLQESDHAFPTAYAFRRHLQKSLPRRLEEFPSEDPLSVAELRRDGRLPEGITARWSPAPPSVADVPIDHSVPPVEAMRGGERAGGAALARFLDGKLERYDESRNHPDREGTSRLSPYLHFGHLSIHEVVTALFAREGWSPDRLAPAASGGRAGWWGLSAAAEGFLDQAVTWRELGHNFCAHRGDYDRFEALPDWAKRTLALHASDARSPVYDLDTFASAGTHDPLWNAAQRQLLREGHIHNALRMLWGKKILEWSRSPEDAAEIMVELNDRFALDGRDPNSYSGIFWVLGRYDRPWGPERPVFGTVRYMSSENSARKWEVKATLRRYGAFLFE